MITSEADLNLEYRIRHIPGSSPLKPCPFCGFKLDVRDPDCIYPTSREKSLYSINCYESGGGCSTSILGDSIADVFRLWNKRQ